MCWTDIQKSHVVTSIKCSLFLLFITIHHFSKWKFQFRSLLYGSHVFTTIWFIFVFNCNFKCIKWPQTFFLVSSHSVLEEPTKLWQQQQNKWIILDVRSVCFEKDQYVCVQKCCQICFLPPFQERWFWIRRLEKQKKGKNFVKATSIAGSVSNYSIQFWSRKI